MDSSNTGNKRGKRNYAPKCFRTIAVIAQHIFCYLWIQFHSGCGVAIFNSSGKTGKSSGSCVICQFYHCFNFYLLVK